MVQTKEMKNYKTEVTDNNRIEYLHFFGIKYPFIETDGMKIASDELEYAIRNHPNSPEGFELMEEIVLSFKMPFNTTPSHNPSNNHTFHRLRHRYSFKSL